MPTMHTMVDDPDVGRGGSEYFKPTTNKQRIAIIPFWIPESTLVIPDDLRAKAAKEEAAADELEYKLKFAELLKEGTEMEPPRTLREERNGVVGFRYCRMDSGMVHYDTTVNYYFCKAKDYAALGRESECCKKSVIDAVAAKKPKEYGDAQRLYAFVLIVYNTDAEGNILKLAPEARRPLDDKHKLDFKYEFKTWAINDSKIKGLKQYTKKFPPIACDYEVWTQKKGNSDIVMFSPCAPPGLWLARGPVLEKRILEESEPHWDKINRTLGKELTIEEVDKLCGVGAGVATKPKTEKNFSGLLG